MGLTRPSAKGCQLSPASIAAASIALPSPVHRPLVVLERQHEDGVRLHHCNPGSMFCQVQGVSILFLGQSRTEAYEQTWCSAHSSKGPVTKHDASICFH